MNNKFDELTKQMAQSVTRRQAFKKFGVGLAGMALAAFGLANKAGAARLGPKGYCAIKSPGLFAPPGESVTYTGMCMDLASCVSSASADCPAPGTLVGGNIKPYHGCGSGLFSPVDLRKACSFTT